MAPLSAAALPSGGGTALVAEGLVCGYAPGQTTIAADLRAGDGTACVIAGRSGSGRTTLALALAGFMPRLTGGWRRGRVALVRREGHALEQAATAPADWLAAVGWSGGSPRAGLTWSRRTVAGELGFGLEQRGVAPAHIAQRTAAMLAAIGLDGLADRDPSTLSDGETARLALGSILVLEPEALVVDDPEAYLDGAGLRDLLQLVEATAADRAVVLLTSRPAALADALPRWFAASRAHVLDVGRVAASGPARSLLAAPDVACYGILPALPASAPASASSRLGGETEACAAMRPNGTADDEGSADPIGDAAGWHASEDVWAALAPEQSTCLLSATGIAVAFGGRPALRGLSVWPEAGAVTGLVGGNGGGKTTLLRAFAGLVVPSEGRVRVGNADPARAERRATARRVALCGSRPEDQVVARTVAGDVAVGLHWVGVPRRAHAPLVAAALSASGLTDHADAHPHDLPASGRRWHAIAAALVLRTPVVLLDEPTVGLDAIGQLRLEAAIHAWRRQGRTVVVASHDLDFVAEVADRVVVLSGGLVRADGPAGDVLADGALLADADLVSPARLALARALGLPLAGAGSRAALWRALGAGPAEEPSPGPRYNSLRPRRSERGNARRDGR